MPTECSAAQVLRSVDLTDVSEVVKETAVVVNKKYAPRKRERQLIKNSSSKIQFLKEHDLKTTFFHKKNVVI